MLISTLIFNCLSSKNHQILISHSTLAVKIKKIFTASILTCGYDDQSQTLNNSTSKQQISYHKNNANIDAYP